MADPFKGSKLMFCDVLGEVEFSFALLPRRCFDGSWVWLRPIAKRLCVLKAHLDGPRDPFWQYAKLPQPTPEDADT